MPDNQGENHISDISYIFYLLNENNKPRSGSERGLLHYLTCPLINPGGWKLECAFT